MPKYAQIADAIQARVRHGDYRLRGFPSHAGLVAELGVNSRTVAKALSSLVERGVLVRDEAGKFDIPEAQHARVVHVGILSPPTPSQNIMRWHQLIHEACQQRSWLLRPLAYSHWHDMTITEALRGTDGLFFLSIGDDFPELVINQVKASEVPVVVLEQDVSSEGIPCLRYSNPGAINKLVEHLRKAGHSRVACLNAQPHSKVIAERIAAWQLWSSAQGVQGELHDEPVKLGGDAAYHAYDVVKRLLRQDKLGGTALVCTTSYTAIGAMRAIRDAGLQPGRDVGVCSVEEWDGVARLLSPSLTSLVSPDMRPLIQVCLDYFERSSKEWMGPMLVQPSSMELFEGESTKK